MGHQRHIWVVILYLLVSAQTAVYGQDQQEPKPQNNSPEEILLTEIPVVTAAKKLQKESLAPASVIVITAEDIKNSGARTIAEAIQHIPGVNSFGIQGINFRGAGSETRILLLVDGRRCNDVFTGGFENGFERPLTNIERIEVIKGPASSLYGTNAFAGIINLITKKGNENKGISVRVTAGNFTTQNYETVIGATKNDVDLLFSFSAHADKGNSQVASATQARDFELYGKIKWKDFTFSGGYRPNESFLPNPGLGLLPLTLKRFDSFGDIQYENTFHKRWSVSAQIYLQHEVAFFPDPSRNFDARDLRIEGEGRLNYKFNEQDNVTIGFELRRDRTNNVKPLAIEQYRSSNRSFYIENELNLTQRLTITTGVRVDNNSIFGTTGNPRLGIVATLPSRTIIKGFYGRAFRAPDFINLFTDTRLGPFLIMRNPDLKPETINSFEGEVSQRLTGWMEGRVNIYHNSLRNLISTDLTGTVATFSNIGKVSSDGIEMGIKARMGKDLTVFANHSIQFARNEITRNPLLNVPRNTSNIGVTYHFQKNYTLSIYGKYTSPVPATETITGRRITLRSYVKGDFVFSAQISQRLECSAAIYNFSNFHFNQTTGPQEDRVQAIAGIKFNLW